MKSALVRLTCLGLFATLFITTVQAQSQLPHRCATDDHLEEQIKNNPDIVRRIQADDQYYEHYLNNNTNNIHNRSSQKTSDNNLGMRTVYTIPVVVHVMHDGDRRTLDSISVAQVESQFKALFQTYRRVPGTMGFGAGTDMQIEFSLATIDPQGRPTTGVVYHRNPRLADLDRSTEDAELKQSTAWDRKKYLNIWLVNNISSITPEQGILGYAQFPTMDERTDGIVVRSYVFGTIGTAGMVQGLEAYRFGRTTTHECGHWLNLFHPFQGGCSEARCTSGGDRVCDTPPVSNETFGFGEERKNTCTNDNPDRPDNVRNYMDYLNDEGLNFFTEGQKARAFAALDNPAYPQRYDVWQDRNLRATGAGPYKKPEADFWANNLTPCIDAPVTFYDYSMGSPNEFYWEFEGATPSTSTEMSPTVRYRLSGSYPVRLIVKNASGKSDTIVKSNFINVRALTVVDYPFTEDFSRPNFPPTNWTVHNPDAANTRLSKTWIGFRGTAMIRGFDYSDYGQYDDLISPTFDFFDLKNPTLSYRWAYAPFRDRSNRNYLFGDTFEIFASRDCGASWKMVFRRSVNTLSSIGTYVEDPIDQPFDDQWKNQTVCLDEYAGNASVRLAFRFTSGYGNNLFLDDIKLEDNGNRECPVSRQNILEPENWKLVPNPTDKLAELRFHLKQSQSIEVKIYNSLGQEVGFLPESDYPAGEHNLNLTLPDVSGIYSVVVQSGQNTLTFKLLKP